MRTRLEIVVLVSSRPRAGCRPNERTSPRTYARSPSPSALPGHRPHDSSNPFAGHRRCDQLGLLLHAGAHSAEVRITPGPRRGNLVHSRWFPDEIRHKRRCGSATGKGRRSSGVGQPECRCTCSDRQRKGQDCCCEVLSFSGVVASRYSIGAKRIEPPTSFMPRPKLPPRACRTALAEVIFPRFVIQNTSYYS